ncbi:hypothetical protein [Cytobacillus oceanisediminis]|uniref:hypothetical protein n=1 Tax=Cytobacillus oceanisediminis TaxID=665099 RepID=UPI00373631CF
MPSLWENWKETALASGIDRQTFNSRLRYRWEPKDAATYAKGTSPFSDWDKWKEVAKQNGITEKTFKSRIWVLKHHPERAATQPYRKTNRKYN